MADGGYNLLANLSHPTKGWTSAWTFDGLRDAVGHSNFFELIVLPGDFDNFDKTGDFVANKTHTSCSSSMFNCVKSNKFYSE